MRGRVLSEETTHEYDDDTGRLVRVSTVHEPLWLREDRALALALDSYERSLCGECGHPRDRAWHPDMDGWYEAKEIHCNACAALQRKAREDAESKQGTPAGRKLAAVDTRPPDLPLHPIKPAVT